MVTDCKQLEEDVQERDKAANKLEGAEVKLITSCHKSMLKGGDKEKADPRQILEKEKRPTHKLKFLIGKKVDTIDWARDEIPRMTRENQDSTRSQVRRR